MDFQLQLHQDNQRRFERQEEITSKMLVQLTEIAANTAIIPSLVERVTDLEESRTLAKGKIVGGMAVVTALGPALSWAAFRVFHLRLPG